MLRYARTSLQIPGKLFKLYRVDDNGNYFTIDVFTYEYTAKARLKELEDRGHKQGYFINPSLQHMAKLNFREEEASKQPTQRSDKMKWQQCL